MKLQTIISKLSADTNARVIGVTGQHLSLGFLWEKKQ